MLCNFMHSIPVSRIKNEGKYISTNVPRSNIPFLLQNVVQKVQRTNLPFGEIMNDEKEPESTNYDTKDEPSIYII